MKKKAILIPFLVLWLIFPLLAHPPSEINVQYDPASKLLTLDILHPTPDIQKHLINEVEIQMKGRWIFKQEFSAQLNAERQRAIFLLALFQPGDEIDIIAKCNISGKKKISFVIPKG